MKKIIASILFLMPLVSMAITHKDIEESVAPYFSGDLRYYEWDASEPNLLWLNQSWVDTVFSDNTILITWSSCVKFNKETTHIINAYGFIDILPCVCINTYTPILDQKFYRNRWLQFSVNNVWRGMLNDENTGLGGGMYILSSHVIAYLLSQSNTVFYQANIGEGNIEFGEFSKLARWRLSSALTCIRNLGIKFK